MKNIERLNASLDLDASRELLSLSRPDERLMVWLALWLHWR